MRFTHLNYIMNFFRFGRRAALTWGVLVLATMIFSALFDGNFADYFDRGDFAGGFGYLIGIAFMGALYFAGYWFILIKAIGWCVRGLFDIPMGQDRRTPSNHYNRTDPI